jgi:putative tryptophan/tyrosine transport system substrate-binding protein
VKRREFITLIGGTLAWPLAARAQQRKLPIIGFLGGGTSSSWNQWATAFIQQLRQLGWIDGRTIAIEFRWAEGRSERYAEIAAEFVRLKVDVIVTSGGAALVAKQITSDIRSSLQSLAIRSVAGSSRVSPDPVATSPDFQLRRPI